MLNLNDDCILEIMSYLSLSDLYNVSRICGRLNRIAEQAYRRFARLDANDFLLAGGKLKTLRKMSIIIKQMVRHVTSFQICRKVYSQNGLVKCRGLIILVLVHCDKLTDLKIGFHMQDERSIREISALKNFRKLETINMCNNVKLKNFSQLKNLTLKIEKNDFNVKQLLCLANLQSLCLNIPIELSPGLLLRICENNPTLKRITLNILTDILIKIIVCELVHLEDFTLPQKSKKVRITVSGIQPISSIKSLVRFTASNSTGSLLTNLAHIDQLESLTLIGDCSLDVYKIKYFTKLKYLKTANLTGIQLNALKSQATLEHLDISDSNVEIENEDVVRFVAGAIKLKYLTVCRCKGLDETLLSQLSEIIASSGLRHKLTVVCDVVRKKETKNYPNLNISSTNYPQFRSINISAEIKVQIDEAVQQSTDGLKKKLCTGKLMNYLRNSQAVESKLNKSLKNFKIALFEKF